MFKISFAPKMIKCFALYYMFSFIFGKTKQMKGLKKENICFLFSPEKEVEQK